MMAPTVSLVLHCLHATRTYNIFHCSPSACSGDAKKILEPYHLLTLIQCYLTIYLIHLGTTEMLKGLDCTYVRNHG
ncbi:hypothetical protein F4820DRAFT_416855 [Hypoxylon rubiginosum]|uniref:Uncharacterized protein n=1 Tax=Hypoxylon rubiginosum TaxID=110542 RepID=A0ACB9Z3L4_9PEZI|nr:hypothetical protein F4820DRAFT_416855 [Hypoxylon rubiginosum]